MLQYLAKANDQCHIVTTDDKPNLPEFAHGFPIWHTWGFQTVFYPVCVTFDNQLKALRSMLKFRPDVAHITTPGLFFLGALLWARVLRVPVVMVYHTHLPEYCAKYWPRNAFWLRPLAWLLISTFHGMADLTLVTSPQLKAEFEAHGIKRVDVWRKGVDTDNFNPKYFDSEVRCRMLGGVVDDAKDFLIVIVGRIDSAKNIHLLKPILQKVPNARLCVVGAGPETGWLKEDLKGTATTFLGELRGEQLSKVFASADAFVMPSETETLGFVVLESMASGVPVVGAKAGGIPSIIEDGVNSFLATPNDVESFAEKLNLLRTNKKLRMQMSVKGRSHCEKWGWEAATSVLRNVQYETAIENYKWRGFWGFGGWTDVYLREKVRDCGKWVLGGPRRWIGGESRLDDSCRAPR